VVLDESAMTDTASLAAIHARVDAAGAKLLLVGDHRQLAAAGAGGAMNLIAASGARYELAEARRFNQEWEREASLRLRAGDETVLRDYHQHGRLLGSGTAEQAEDSAARAWLGDTLAGRRSLLIVDTNEQAARVSAAIRAEFVRLGQVEESGVALGLQGTVAGVGDLVEARKLDWTIAGYEGNRRHAINREHYRIQAVRADGALEVAVVEGRTPEGDVLGERLVLPPAYVAQHLALGYASTVNAAQGGTVDSTHTVVTGRTGPAALYVGMSRGRDDNTAHVATLVGVEDPAQGNDTHTLHREPIAVLARILDTADLADVANRSAVATATEAATQAGSVRTAAELLADAAQLAATERTATWLDQLADTGAITGPQRARIAAEDGAASLTRILRRAELAGQDPRQVLCDAVADRPLDGARNTTNVLYSRIADERRFDPVGESWADWTPRVENPEWQRYLDTLAAAADERVEQLGRAAASEQPAWAVEALGPVPVDGQERVEWQRQVGAVAAYREMAGHDDPAEALGPAPKPGQVEAYAAYCAAWRVLGRPEIDREELELSNGQLRMRIRANDREAAWAPRYVANELAGTRQAAAAHRHTAALRAAEATAATDPDQRARLAGEGADAAALAETLDARAAELQQLDDARSRWLAHTAGTRAAADRSTIELAARHVDDDAEEQRVTAEQWLAAHRAADELEDPHRDITDTDMTELANEHEPAPADIREQDRHVAEPPVADIRDVAAAEPPPVDEDAVRVPDAAETSAAIDRAQRGLAEIHAREAAEEREAAEHRAEDLSRWHDADQPLDETDAEDHAMSAYDEAGMP